MSEYTFQWDKNGDNTQTFVLGNINQSNQNIVFDSTYTVSGFVPGVPYTITATSTNVRTDEETTFTPNDGETVWFESNIDHIAFTKEYLKVIDISVKTASEDELSIKVSHALDSYPDIDAYTIRYDFFAEDYTSGNVNSISTYELTMTETEQIFPMVGLEPNTSYDVYCSIAVNPNDGVQDEWYYVQSHQFVTSVETADNVYSIHFDDPDVGKLFTDVL